MRLIFNVYIISFLFLIEKIYSQNCICPMFCLSCDTDCHHCNKCLDNFHSLQENDAARAICEHNENECVEYADRIGCKICKDGYYTSYQTDHQFYQKEYKCLKCDENCKKCENVLGCTECASGYGLTDGGKCEKLMSFFKKLLIFLFFISLLTLGFYFLKNRRTPSDEI